MKTPQLLNEQAEKFRQLGVLHGYLRAHHAPDDVIEALCVVTRIVGGESAAPAAPATKHKIIPNFDGPVVPDAGVRQTDPRWENGFTKTAGSTVGGSGDKDLDEDKRVEQLAEGKKRRAWDALEKAQCWKHFENGMKPKRIAEKLNDEFGNGRDNIGVSAMLQKLKTEEAA